MCYTRIICHIGDNDEISYQEEINSLAKWCTENHLVSETSFRSAMNVDNSLVASNSAHTLFCPVKIKHSNVGTRGKTHFLNGQRFKLFRNHQTYQMYHI